MRQFGLIGFPLSHSFSQKYFTEKFLREKIGDTSYTNYSIGAINDLPGIIKSNPALEGLNVTIPYKEQVIPFLNEMHETVKEIRACNCIKIIGGKLVGYNTDVIGFRECLKRRLLPGHRPALILGTGGASKAVAFVLKNLSIPFSYVSRKAGRSANILGYQNLDTKIIEEHKLIINTTPLGMYPNTEQYPQIPYAGIGSSHYLFDLIYNPPKTEYLLRGERAGAIVENGADMLVLQAEESWRLWNQER